ncbi:hypothetical protein [Paenibacillus sp. FSL K6-2524]|uniref:hypothetical protein n=1 Tax=Paenibacillus sp. FSL K6-2524 TaxID=2954516 RepID=UPI0030F809C8
MKRVLVAILSLSLLVPSLTAFATPAHSQLQTVPEVNTKSVLTEKEMLDIVNQQLDAQNASPESYEFFRQMVKNQFAKKEGISVRGVDDLVYAPDGGEVFYNLKSGSMFVARVEIQYLSPSTTKSIISKYKDSKLTTWQDLAIALAGIFVGKKFPIIGSIMEAYGALGVLSDYLTSETIRSIERAGGQSMLYTYTTSRGKDTVWAPWQYYSYFEVPDFDQYTTDISYKVY